MTILVLIRCAYIFMNNFLEKEAEFYKKIPPLEKNIVNIQVHSISNCQMYFRGPFRPAFEKQYNVVVVS